MPFYSQPSIAMISNVFHAGVSFLAFGFDPHLMLRQKQN